MRRLLLILTLMLSVLSADADEVKRDVANPCSEAQRSTDSARMEVERLHRLKDSLYNKASAEAQAKYNAEFGNDQLQEGEVIWLKKKQSKAPKDYKGRLHYVRSGESMYSIAQQYGIRLKKLYKMNNLSPDYQIKVGDGLRLR